MKQKMALAEQLKRGLRSREFLFLVVALIVTGMGINADARTDEVSRSVQTCKQFHDSLVLVNKSNRRPVICVNGELKGSRFTTKYMRALKRVNGKGKTPILVVSSVGGEATVAMEIAERLGNYDVVVSGVCLSACANYLFLPAKKKTLWANSVIGWHGGAIRTDAEFDAFWFRNRTRLLNLTESKVAEAELKENIRREFDHFRTRENNLLNWPDSKALDIIYFLPKAKLCISEDVILPRGNHYWRPSLMHFAELFGVENVTAVLPDDYQDAVVFVFDEKVVDWPLPEECIFPILQSQLSR